MKLLRLYIGKYRVLEDFELQFAPFAKSNLTRRASNYALDFLVGVNGTGKSTVLRGLSEIFQRLDGDTKQANFIFEIEYLLRNRRIFISNRNPDTNLRETGYRVRTAEGVEAYGPEALVDDVSSDNLLPEVIIAYTTGSEAEWFTKEIADIFEVGDPERVALLTPEEQAIQEIPGRLSMDASRASQQGRRFLFVQKQHMPIVTLCGLLTNLVFSNSARSIPLSNILKEAKIGRFCGFSLRFRMNQSMVERNEIHQRLGQFATRVINVGSEYLFIYDYSNGHNAEKILQESSNGLELYRFLATLLHNTDTEQILTQVNIFLERTTAIDADETTKPPLHLFEWLSDGEQSFVGRMCLFTLFGGNDAFILLDEPEVHFNDYWKRRIVYFIDQVYQAWARRKAPDAEKLDSAHVLISTHSSIALTDARSTDIMRLERAGAKTSRAATPSFQTFGADPSDIMVHIFDAPQPSGEYSVQRIKDRLEDARKGNITKEELQEDLKHIAPGYWSYRVRREIIRI